MIITAPHALTEILLFQPRIFRDDRGDFRELFNEERYAAAGLSDRFVQDNVSRSNRHVLRGLHLQHPRAQGKLVSVLDGAVFDVAVDVRRGSPTFGQWGGFMLSAENGHQVWIPPGFAHGFVVLSERAVFSYKCTELYTPSAELTIRWDDPAIGIDWPVPAPIVSDKDAAGLSLGAVGDRLPEWTPTGASAVAATPSDAPNAVASSVEQSTPVILITGADGQVGWEACRAFAALGRVVPLRRADVDLTNGDALRRAIRALRPALIVNAAAYTAVDRAETEAATAFAVNAAAPRVLAEEAASLGAVLVHYSTDYVFDGSASVPYTERDPTAPLGVYGESKLAGDRAIAASGAPHLIFRTSWVYAARGQNFLRTMLRLAHEREVLRVVADQRGAPTPARLIATVSAQVLARHATATGFSLAESPWGVYNLVTRGVTTWHQFALGILARDPRRDAQRCREVVPIATADYPTAARRPAFSVLDPTKLERTFGLHMPDWSTQLDLVMQELQ